MVRKVRGVQFARLRTLISNFRSNSSGNVAMITALVAVPMIGAVGCAIDYSNAVMIRTKLQAAADAAALATVSFNSPVVATAANMTGDGTVSGGLNLRSQFFRRKSACKLFLRDADGHRYKDRYDNNRNRILCDSGSYLLRGIGRLPKRQHSGLIHSKFHAVHLHRFLPDARRLRIHELPLDGHRANKIAGGQP